MTRLFVSLLAGTILLGTGSAPAQTPDRTVTDARIDSLATSLIGSAVPGLAVLAIEKGRVVHRAAYGRTSVESGGPVTIHTPFYVASLAKMFTAAAVLRLADEGRIRLDDPLERHLDVVPDYAREVTVAQVLTHSSGLPDHYEIGGEDRGYTEQDVLEILHEAGGLDFPPGTRAGYSNSGFVLLARLVERVSGEPFDRFLETRFFEPLGMDDATVASGGVGPADRAIGHRGTDGDFEPWDYPSSTVGAGGVYASLSDLERWYRGLAEGRVLESETLRLASRPPDLEGGALTPFGMGWLAEFAAGGPLADRWYVFSFGSLRGYRAVFQWYQEDEVLLVWLANGCSDRPLETFMTVPDLLIHGPSSPSVGDPR